MATYPIKYFTGFEQGNIFFYSRGGTAACRTQETEITKSPNAIRFTMAAQSSYAMHYGVYDSDGVWTETAVHGWPVFHMYVVALPTGATKLTIYTIGDDGDSTRCEWYINSSGKVVVANGADVVTSVGAISTGEWYTVSIKALGDAHPNIVVRDEDGNTVATAESDNNTADDKAPHWNLGPRQTSTGTVIFDNYVFSASTTSSDLGDMVDVLGVDYTVETLRPVGAGTYQEQDSGDWSDLDECPHDSDTTQVVLNDGDVRFTATPSSVYDFDELIDEVHAIFNWYIGRNTGSYSCSARHSMRIQGTLYEGDSVYLPTDDVWYLRGGIYDENPYTSAAWELEDFLSDFEFGIRSTVNTSSARITVAGVEILFSPRNRGGGSVTWWW